MQGKDKIINIFRKQPRTHKKDKRIKRNRIELQKQLKELECDKIKLENQQYTPGKKNFFEKQSENTI